MAGTHVERHMNAPEMIRDIVIGMADGLTVPFALAAGLAGSVPTPILIVTAGFAEIAAGSIAMGLGGYLAVRTDHEHYESELALERKEIREVPDRERAEVAEIFQRWGLDDHVVQSATDTICSDDERWAQFMMTYELGLAEPKPSRARNSSLTIAISYIVGGFVPLTPYILIPSPATALLYSAIVTLAALFVFGFIKGKFTGTSPWKSAAQTTMVGGVAAGVAYMAARWLA